MIDCFRHGRIVSMTVFDNKILAALKGGLASGDRCSLGVTSIAVAPSGNIYPCERLVAEDEDHRWVTGHVETGFTVKGEACARGPINPECNDCGERFRCASSCACANLAETGRTDTAGGTQCWHERQTAVLADRIAGTLWAEQNPLFIAWFYGRMTGVALPAEGDAPLRRKNTEVKIVPRAKPSSGKVKLEVVR
jgi:radical SAM protein with 4Fe4S-binding SPASM domain